MKVHFFKRAAAFAFVAVIITILALPVGAVNYSAGAGTAGRPYETVPEGGNNGGRLGENRNAPAANGGGEGNVNGNGNINGSDRANDNGAVDGMYADTTEDGEVLGVMDTESSATAGIVIAILIAVAVIVLIIALIPKSASDT